jgi:hypothetical protein
MKGNEILRTNISAQRRNASDRRIRQAGAAIGSILAAGLVAMAVGLVAMAVAGPNSLQQDPAITNGAEASPQREVERGGSMTGYQSLW